MRWLDGIPNPMDLSLNKLQEILDYRGAWGTAVYGTTKSQTRLSDWITTNSAHLSLTLNNLRCNVCISTRSYSSLCHLNIKAQSLEGNRQRSLFSRVWGSRGSEAPQSRHPSSRERLGLPRVSSTWISVNFRSTEQGGDEEWRCGQVLKGRNFRRFLWNPCAGALNCPLTACLRAAMLWGSP